MASTLREAPAQELAATREARIAERTDALCLKHLLAAGRQSWMLLPHALLMAFLAVREGSVVWAALWLIAWVAREILSRRFSNRLLMMENEPPGPKLKKLARGYFAAGVVAAGLLPLFFIHSKDTELLAVMVMLTIYSAAALHSASGILRAWLSYILPLQSVLLIGWLWHGGLMGYVTTGFLIVASPLGIAVVRSQRRSLEALMRVLDDNETLSKALALERDRAQAERDRAEAASASKTRFFAAASHDLRQPLHALSINATTLDLVARRSGDPLLKEVSQGITSALRQSSGLLDGLLDISRLDAHAVKLHLAPHDLGAVLEGVREEYAALAEQHGLSLQVDMGAAKGQGAPWVMTDVDQLARILGNLVDNAIKFTRQGGITLSVRRDSAGRENTGRVWVRVSDTGPGIAQAEQERVFEEFYQVGNPSRDRTQGLGLGLAIVKRTAALLEMPIQLVSEPGRGTTFELSLPAAVAPDLPMSPPASDPADLGDLAEPFDLGDPGDPGSGEPLSVLLVDDEPEVLLSLCTYLRQIGWSARGAASGREAEVALAEGFQADVLVVDFRLRDETGLDVIERLRALYPSSPALPAVIVTGDTAAERLREFDGIAASVLHKPVDGRKLALALRDAVGR